MNANDKSNGNPNASTALVAPGQAPPAMIGSDAFRNELEPHTLAEAFNVCEMIASTKLFGVTTAEDAMVRLMTGRGLGLTAMQSLRAIYVVDGKPGMDASFMQALCLQSPACEEFVHVSSDETHATFRAKRRGQEAKSLTFKLEDAQRQGLVDRGTDPKKNNWNRMPKQMCEARAKSSLARLVFPDLLFGMYSKEELIDGDVVELAPVAGAGGTTYERPAALAVQAAKRDFATEAGHLKAQILAAKTKEEKATLRKAIEAWDAPEHLLAEIKALYNETHVAKKPESRPAVQQELGGAGAEPAAREGSR